MKNKLTTLVPAVALLALSGCASTSGLTSTTESDGVYYSSQDKTTQTVTASVAPDDQYTTQGIDEDTNPEYSNNNRSNATSGSTEYYDDSYASRLGRFNGSTYSGLSYYSPVYTDPYFMGGGYGGAFAPYYGLGMGYGSFYDPFYSPFNSPFGYGFGGSSLSIGLGFGNYWGGRPYYGLGYGGLYDGFYNPYYGYGGLYGGGLYGGYYGRGYGYGYGNSGYWGGGDNRRTVRYAPRVDRAREAVSASRPVGGGRGGRYVSQGGMTALPNTSGVTTPGTSVVGNAEPRVAPGRARGRILDPSASQQANGLASPNNYNVNERAMSNAERGAREGRMSNRMSETSTRSTEQPRLDYSGRGRRGQMVDNASGSTTPQDYQQPARRSRFSESFRNNSTSQSQSAPQRSESRTYSQPTRTYEPAPARMSSPSFGGSSGGGGGSFGGGGGGGGRGRVR